MLAVQLHQPRGGQGRHLARVHHPRDGRRDGGARAQMQPGGRVVRHRPLDRLPAGHAPPVHRGAADGPHVARGGGGPHDRWSDDAVERARLRRLRAYRHVAPGDRVRHARAHVAHGGRPAAADADAALLPLPAAPLARLLSRARHLARQPRAVPRAREEARRRGPVPAQAGRLRLLATDGRALQRRPPHPAEPRLARAARRLRLQALWACQRPLGARHGLCRGGVRQPRPDRVHDDPRARQHRRDDAQEQPADDGRGRAQPAAQAAACRADGAYHGRRGAVPPVLRGHPRAVPGGRPVPAALMPPRRRSSSCAPTRGSRGRTSSPASPSSTARCGASCTTGSRW